MTSYSVAPPPQDGVTEQPIMENAASEGGATHAKTKWSFSGIIQELRQQHKLKKHPEVPGVRQSILAVLKSSCKTFTSCRRLAPTLPDCVIQG